MVEQKLAEWQIYNVDPSTDNYMNEGDMKACIEYIIKKIIVEMTPVQKDVLSVGYPMDNQDDMIESIKNRAKLSVMNFAVKQNAPQEHSEAVKNINAF